MKKNTIIFLLVFLALGGAAAYFMLNQSNTTLNKNAQDFAIEDTAAVYSIRLSDKVGNVSVLERKAGGVWMVNDKYKAQKSYIKTLLETMKLVQVKNPVPLQGRDNAIKIMSTTATKVEAFDKDGDLLNSYYVGGTTPDELGTFMLRENATEPFVTHIPGFFGYLSTRYITKERDWRSNEIYALNPSEIKEITVRYHAVPDASFKLLVRGNKYFIMPFQGSAEQELKPLEAKRLLAGYRSIVYEQFPELLPQKRDSILSSKPLITVNVYTQKEPQPPVLKLYLKQADDRTKGVGPDGSDLDKFYGVVGEGNREVMLVQSGVVAKILPSYQDLIK